MRKLNLKDQDLLKTINFRTWYFNARVLAEENLDKPHKQRVEMIRESSEYKRWYGLLQARVFTILFVSFLPSFVFFVVLFLFDTNDPENNNVNSFLFNIDSTIILSLVCAYILVTLVPAWKLAARLAFIDFEKKGLLPY